jgi:hypothetical protein
MECKANSVKPVRRITPLVDEIVGQRFTLQLCYCLSISEPDHQWRAGVASMANAVHNRPYTTQSVRRTDGAA